jgi:hypothetical protein
MNSPDGVPSTDILRLFREDLTLGDRVTAFQQAADQLRDEVLALATPSNVTRINGNFDIAFVFNSHGDAIDAGQSTAVLQNPFIAFVENAGDEDIGKNLLFTKSTENAFNIRFNGAEPMLPQFPLTRDNGWAYWRDRGILARGSIIAPIDIRHYSRRLLDALMGSDYDQSYLNSSIPVLELRSSSFDELHERQKQKGLLIMHSNAVRELTSTKQVLETLLQCLETEQGSSSFAPDIQDKIRAIAQKDRLSYGKLPVYIIYGGAHHAAVHILRKMGIKAGRQFPGGVDVPGKPKYIGTVKDQFFSIHPFGITDEQTDRYARQHILESILWAPVDLGAEYGMVPESDQTMINFWYKINYAARRTELISRVDQIFDEFKRDPMVPVRILRKYGIKLRAIGTTAIS